MPGAEAIKLPAPSLDGAPQVGDAVADASANLESLAIVPSSATKGKGELSKPKPAQVLVPTQTKSIGIIHPPPDIRGIVDKTATFVARNGPEFERKILATNRGNAKFNFLNPTDPYHAYYRFKVNETASQLGIPLAAPIPAPPPPSASASGAGAGGAAAQSTTAGILTTPDKDKDTGDGVVKGPKPPEPELYTVRVPEGLSGLDLDVIKLTAQFVARNGKAFLTGLISREHMNPQFHFLKPTHSLFTFFTALADAYTRVLNPPRPVLHRIKEHVEGGYSSVLATSLARLEWERSQERARKQAEDEVEQERVQMALIDWHDFVVVETIGFADGEDFGLPPPVSQEELVRKSRQLGGMEEEEEEVQGGAEAAAGAGAGGQEGGLMVKGKEMDEEERKLVEAGMQEGGGVEGGVEGEGAGGGGGGGGGGDEEREPEGDGPAPPPPEEGLAPPPPPEDEEDEEMDMEEEDEAPMKIVKDWKRPEERDTATVDPTKVVVSPITGELVAVSEMAEHMRISLIDPKYKEQKERMLAKLRDNTLAHDDEITRNIVGLARTRPDIFGTTEEEVSNAVRQEIEKKKEEPSRVMWDGHTASIGRTANQALQQSLTGANDVAAVPADSRPTAGPQPPPPQPRQLPPRPLPPPGQPIQMLRPGIQGAPQYPPGMPMVMQSVPIINPATGRTIGQANMPVPAHARPPTMQQLHHMHPPPGMPGAPGVPPVMPGGAPTSMGGRPMGSGVLSGPPGVPTGNMGMRLGPPPPSMASLPHMAPGVPQGMAPGVPQGMQGMMAGMPQGGGGPPGVSSYADEDRDSKRQRTDEPQLIPEMAYLAQHPGPVRITVTLPAVDGEPSLNGQSIHVTVGSLSETTGALKELIAAEIGLPANKQKLSGHAGFFKDSVSLAYYNVGPGETVAMSLKERGGRKK